MNKQISLTLPQTLFKASKDYSEEMGYRSTQEFIVDLVRRKVMLEEEERLRGIEREMDKSVKGFKSKKEALEHLDRI